MSFIIIEFGKQEFDVSIKKQFKRLWWGVEACDNTIIYVRKYIPWTRTASILFIMKLPLNFTQELTTTSWKSCSQANTNLDQSSFQTHSFPFWLGLYPLFAHNLPSTSTRFASIIFYNEQKIEISKHKLKFAKKGEQKSVEWKVEERTLRKAGARRRSRYAISPLSRTLEIWLQQASSDTEASQKRAINWLSAGWQRVALRAITLQDRSLISNYIN